MLKASDLENIHEGISMAKDVTMGALKNIMHRQSVTIKGTDMEAMMGSLMKRKRYSDRIKRSDPYLKKIYADIVEYNPKMHKMKPDKLKIQRHQIYKHI